MPDKPKAYYQKKLQKLSDEKLDVFHRSAKTNRDDYMAGLAAQESARRKALPTLESIRREKRRRLERGKKQRKALETLTNYDFRPLRQAVLDALIVPHGEHRGLVELGCDPIDSPVGLSLATSEQVRAVLAPLAKKGIFPTRYRVVHDKSVRLTRRMVEAEVQFLLNLAGTRPMSKRDLATKRPRGGKNLQVHNSGDLDTPGWLRFLALWDKWESTREHPESVYYRICKLAESVPKCPGCDAPLPEAHEPGDPFGWPTGTDQCPGSDRCRQRKRRKRKESV